ncbi:MAG: hypothetical protein HDR01_10545 [Lachnospiraceae bacterium]|nr:hypothetical protein [Lachnospiraceae bacterium]
MKNINYKTNRPLFLAVLGNFLLLTCNQTVIRAEPGCYLRGALFGFTAVAYLIGFWNMKHETSFSEWKKSLFARLKNKN